MEDRETITFGHIKVFVLGGLVGAVVALLFAPKTGREVREEIKDRAGKLKSSMGENWQTISSKGREVLENVSARGKDVYGKGTEVLSEQKERLSAAVTAGAQAAREAYGKEPARKEADKA